MPIHHPPKRLWRLAITINAISFALLGCIIWVSWASRHPLHF